MTAGEIKPQFDAAVATARQALEEFRKEPIITAKRGGPRLSPWWRVYKEASEVAQRWHRQGEQPDEPDPSFDDELDRLLDGTADPSPSI